MEDGLACDVHATDLVHVTDADDSSYSVHRIATQQFNMSTKLPIAILNSRADSVDENRFQHSSSFSRIACFSNKIITGAQQYRCYFL